MSTAEVDAVVADLRTEVDMILSHCEAPTLLDMLRRSASCTIRAMGPVGGGVPLARHATHAAAWALVAVLKLREMAREASPGAPPA